MGYGIAAAARLEHLSAQIKKGFSAVNDVVMMNLLSKEICKQQLLASDLMNKKLIQQLFSKRVQIV
jgi:hypothetical protein